jgi:ATPase family associated with various cellular activities (AAA)
MTSAAPVATPVTFIPGLEGGDALGNYWLKQITYRLRREICWLWQERGALAVGRGGSLPPFTDKVSTALDLTRYADEKKHFFAADETARYLTSLIESGPPRVAQPPQGSFAWVASEIGLGQVGCFLLALGLLPVVDSAVGVVMAACLNEPARTYATLALAQRLWDKPEELLPFADPAHPLFRIGLLQPAGAIARESLAPDWETPLIVHASLAGPLLFRDAQWPAALRRIPSDCIEPALLPAEAHLVAARLKASAPQVMRMVPIVGAKSAPLAEVAAAIAAMGGRPLVQLELQHGVGPGQAFLAPLATLAWLKGYDIFLPLGEGASGGAEEKQGLLSLALPPAVPLTAFLGIEDKAMLRRLPAAGLLPAVSVPPMNFEARYARWREQLVRGRKMQAPLAGAVADCARRFRYERETIDAIAGELRALRRPFQPADLAAACRAEVTGSIGDLAQPVAPRFELKELMLPHKQMRQIQEIIQGMRVLTRVHYEWGTARAWNESGLCALFAGPPGTGKTMAAEVIAAELDLPLYRIDLSQVVNKYIGETEKNLRRLFDAADTSDVILFFDEADALFGKRTEVKDAHDRYANLEISYLLERMERFKGLAVLATNRKQDLDEAFLRRLRFVVDFPLPGEEERRRIWRQMIPPPVQVQDVDFDFLARQFPLAGGHIRSIVFHACLQSAHESAARWLTMPTLIAAVKSEYDKLNRSISLEQFGPYEETIAKP